MSRLVAHRGQSLSFPENTMESIQAAIDCGASAVEFDIQMTADHVPVLCHDINLKKTARIDIDISKKTFSEIKHINVGESSRFNTIYPDVFLTTLEDMVLFLKTQVQVLVFVELKDESIDVFGIECILQQVTKVLEPINKQCVMIADNLDALLALREFSAIPIGWIIHEWDEEKITLAKQQQLNYLVINHEYCTDEEHDFSSDDMQWVFYETCDADKAIKLFNRGAHFVESNDICSMIKHLPDYK